MTTDLDLVRQLLALGEDRDARDRLLQDRLAAGGVDAFRMDLQELRDASERYLTINPHDALLLAIDLLAGANLAKQPVYQALGLMARADALRPLGRYREAVADFEAARGMFADLGDDIGWARTHLGWVYASHLLGRGTEAIAAVEQAYRILADRGEWLRAAGLDLNTAAVCYDLGRYDEALARYQRAEHTYRRLGPAAANRAAWARANQAIVLTLRGEFDAALALHSEARQVLEQHGETLSVLRQDQYTADVYAGQGNYTRALHRYAEVLDALERGRYATDDAAWVALGMAECYLGLNRPAEAQAHAEEARAHFDRSQTPTEGAKARLLIAQAHVGLGDRARALPFLVEAEQLFANQGLAGYQGLALLQRATLYLDEAAWPLARDVATEAGAAFAARRQVVRQAQAGGGRALSASCLMEDADARPAQAALPRPSSCRLAR